MRSFGRRITATLVIPTMILTGSCSSERPVAIEEVAQPRAGGAPSPTLPAEVEQLRGEGLTVRSSDLVGAIPASSGVSGMGAATYHVPIDVAPGPNGMQPELALTYSSAAAGGNGPLGVGFQLAGLSSISRCTPTQRLTGPSGPCSGRKAGWTTGSSRWRHEAEVRLSLLRLPNLGRGASGNLCYLPGMLLGGR